MSDRSRWSIVSECVIVIVKKNASTCLGAESGNWEETHAEILPVAGFARAGQQTWNGCSG